MDIGVHRSLQVAKVGQCHLPQVQTLRLQRAEFEDAHADGVPPLRRALERPPIAQLADQPVSGAQGQAGASADIAEAQHQVVFVEGLQDGEHPLRGGHLPRLCRAARAC